MLRRRRDLRLRCAWTEGRQRQEEDHMGDTDDAFDLDDHDKLRALVYSAIVD